jgi:membrane peptidoglycan carboxypeptidase
MSAARTAPRTRPTTVGWIAIIIFVFLAGLGTIAALAAVVVFNSVSSNLAPPSQLTKYVLPQETIVYDRTGKIELARFGDAKREVVQFDDIPKVLLDATTAVEDKTFWDNAGFDPLAIVSAAIGS